MPKIKRPLETTRSSSRRQASKEALKQMQLLLDDEEDDAFVIPDDDEDDKDVCFEALRRKTISPIIESPPKKKYKLSHRKSSDGNDRDVIVLKSISNSTYVPKENTLELECFVEDLSEVQIQRRQKIELDEKELQAKLEELLKGKNAEVVYQGEFSSAVEVNELISDSGTKSLFKPNQLPTLDAMNDDSSPAFQLVMDPRLGIIVGTVQKNTNPVQMPPPPLTKSKLQISSAVKAVANLPQSQTPPPPPPATRNMRTRRGTVSAPTTPVQTKATVSAPPTPTQTRGGNVTPIRSNTPVPTRGNNAMPTRSNNTMPTRSNNPIPTRSNAIPTRSNNAIPTRGSNPTPPTRGSNPTPPAKGSNPTPPTRGSNPTPPTRGSNSTPPTRGSNPTPPTRGSNPITTRGGNPTPTRASNPIPTRASNSTPPTRVSNPTPTRGSNPTPTRGSNPIPTRANNPMPTRGATQAVSPTPPTIQTRGMKTPTPTPTVQTRNSKINPTPPSGKRPIANSQADKTKQVVDLTSDDNRSNQVDNREIAFNKLQGKTYPSLVVVARPHLRVSDLGADRSKLDSKVKTVLMHPPTKFTEWLIQQGLIRAEQKCPVHSNTQLKLGMYSDVSKFPFSGGYVWISECCPQRFISVFNGSIFEGSPNPPMVMLKLMYHWSCQTNIQNVTQWVKVDNLYVKGVYTWLRGVCTVAVQTRIRQLGGPGCRIEVGVISLGTTSHDGNQRQVKVEVLGILETSSKFMRLRAVEPMPDGDRNFRKKFSKILEPILQWVHPSSTIVTDLTVDKTTLHQMGFMNVIQTTSNEYNNSNRTIMEYLRRIVPRMFQNTLSLLSRQIIQQFLDELVWREWFGITAQQAFDNIISHLAEQTRTNTQPSLILKLNKVAANPFKSWNGATTTGANQAATTTPSPAPATTIQAPSTPAAAPIKTPVTEVKRYGRGRKSNSPQVQTVQERPTKPVSPDVPEQMVPLENYYYGTIDSFENPPAKIVLNMKCPFCKGTFDNNLQLQNHLFKHAHNVSNDAYVCRYCLTSVSTANELLFHVGKFHPGETKFDNGFVCLICETHYMNPFVLGKHMSKEHSPHELPYECGSCTFRCSNHKQIIDHFYVKHDGGTSIQCPFCLKSTTIWAGGRNIAQNIHYFVQHLQKHQKKQLAKRCGKCNLWFIQKEVLKEHQQKMHVSLRGRLGLVPCSSPRNGVMVPKSKMDKNPCDAEIINFSSLYYNIPSKSMCKECEQVIVSPKHFPSFDSCQNPNCQYSTCCATAMMTHNSKCKGLNSIIPPETLPFEMFCVCGHKDSDGNSMAKHLATCEKKSAYPSQAEAKSATVMHSMLDILGLVRKPEEVPSSKTKKKEEAPSGSSKDKPLKDKEIVPKISKKIESATEINISDDEEMPLAKKDTDKSIKEIDKKSSNSNVDNIDPDEIAKVVPETKGDSKNKEPDVIELDEDVPMEDVSDKEKSSVDEVIEKHEETMKSRDVEEVDCDKIEEIEMEDSSSKTKTETEAEICNSEDASKENKEVINEFEENEEITSTDKEINAESIESENEDRDVLKEQNEPTESEVEKESEICEVEDVDNESKDGDVALKEQNEPTESEVEKEGDICEVEDVDNRIESEDGDVALKEQNEPTESEVEKEGEICEVEDVDNESEDGDVALKEQDEPTESEVEKEGEICEVEDVDNESKDGDVALKEQNEPTESEVEKEGEICEIEDVDNESEDGDVPLKDQNEPTESEVEKEGETCEVDFDNESEDGDVALREQNEPTETEVEKKDEICEVEDDNRIESEDNLNTNLGEEQNTNDVPTMEKTTTEQEEDEVEDETKLNEDHDVFSENKKVDLDIHPEFSHEKDESQASASEDIEEAENLSELSEEQNELELSEKNEDAECREIETLENDGEESNEIDEGNEDEDKEMESVNENDNRIESEMDKIFGNEEEDIGETDCLDKETENIVSNESRTDKETEEIIENENVSENDPEEIAESRIESETEEIAEEKSGTVIENTSDKEDQSDLSEFSDIKQGCEPINEVDEECRQNVEDAITEKEFPDEIISQMPSPKEALTFSEDIDKFGINEVNHDGFQPLNDEGLCKGDNLHEAVLNDILSSTSDATPMDVDLESELTHMAEVGAPMEVD